MAIFRDGIALARRDRQILVVIAATLLINGGGEGFGRLLELRFVALGVPTEPNPIVWFAGLGLVGFALGAGTLRIVEARIDRTGVVRRLYVGASVIGVAQR